MQNSEWFHNLNQPFLAPPTQVFTPVWIILYVLIIISLILFLKSKNTKSKKLPLIFFVSQMILNFSWTPVFFNAQNIGAALIIAGSMWFFTLLCVIFFFQYSKLASLLLLPYLFWLSFAFYLNFGYFVLN